ncbi:hypothetical protein N656DRAFT_777876 [Canariomyces notabilis]|uniref:Uncharacterized protein n=1 Tax=Canariomyces notabilis TaxID=2074819 RepID=A0AAN6TG61_9PEZI|nr:hypothetical protein N656DRAFT_777876 [Canariomyces arenarius]
MTSEPHPTFLTIPLELRLEIYKHLLTIHAIPPEYYCYHGIPTYPHASNPPPPPPSPRPELLHPQILQTNRRVNSEATPVLYALNTFTLTLDAHAHQPQPCLELPLLGPRDCYSYWYCYPPVTSPHLAAQIRHWRLHLALDDHEPFLPIDSSSSSSRRGPTQPQPQPQPPLHVPRSTITTTTTSAASSAPAPATATATTPTAQTPAQLLTNATSVTIFLRRTLGALLGGASSVDALRPLEPVRGVRQVIIEPTALGGGAVLEGFGGYIAWLVGVMGAAEGERVGEKYMPRDEIERRRLEGWGGWVR